MMRPLRAFTVLTLVLATSVVSSCSLFESEPLPENWEVEVLDHAPPRRDLLTECQWALRNAGYPPGEADEALGMVESGWLVSLHPFSKKGRRYKGVIVAEVSPETGEDIIKVRVEVEGNTEKKQPLEPSLAKWEPLGDDPSRADVLMEHVMQQLRQKRKAN